VTPPLLDMLGVPNRGLRADDIRARVTTWLTARADLAWQLPAERLDEAAEEAVFRPDRSSPRRARVSRSTR
jgi:hypothetical protein